MDDGILFHEEITTEIQAIFFIKKKNNEKSVIRIPDNENNFAGIKRKILLTQFVCRTKAVSVCRENNG